MSHQKDDILNYRLNDDRFIFNITSNDTNITDISDYHIYIKSTNDNVAIYKKITK